VARFERRQLLDVLEERGIPAGPINTVADVFADPQVIHRGMRVDLEVAAGPEGPAGLTTVPSVRTPIRFSDAALSLQRPAPRLGEHTQEILAEIGLGAGG